MSTKVEYLVRVAQERDEVCNSDGREYYSDDRRKAFRYRKLARELRSEGGDTINSLTDSSISGAVCVLNLLAEDESLFKEEQDDIRDVAELIEKRFR